jgi:hypothetical protein
MTRNHRLLAATALVATALLSLVSNVTAPDFSGDTDDLLASIADGGGLVALSAMTFVLAQLPFVVGMVGLARWLHPSRVAAVGGVLAALGGFGHAVYGGVMLSQTVMAADTANRPVYADLLTDLEGAAVLIPFMVLGLLGTVLGFLLLSIAWWRSRTEPRWVAPLLWAFLLVEFVGSNVSDWAAYLSVLLYAAALGTAAWRLGRFEPAPVGQRSTALTH